MMVLYSPLAGRDHEIPYSICLTLHQGCWNQYRPSSLLNDLEFRHFISQLQTDWIIQALKNFILWQMIKTLSDTSPPS